MTWAYFQDEVGVFHLIDNTILDSAGAPQTVNNFIIDSLGALVQIWWTIPPSDPTASAPDPDDPTVTIYHQRLYEATDIRAFEATDIRLFDDF